MSLTKKAVKVLEEMIDRIDNDSSYLKQIQDQIMLSNIKSDNQKLYDTYEATTGDMIVYTSDPDFWVKESIRIDELWYQVHGMGD